jgi:hypothetical protein
MLTEFLKAIKDNSQVYFVLGSTILSGEIMKVDYENEFVQVKNATFQGGLSVPFFIIPFKSALAWGIRPK